MVREPVSPFIQQMPADWTLERFGKLLNEPVRNGVYKKKEFHGRGVKIINMGELFAHDFISNQEMRRVELTPKELTKYLVQDGDLLFARRSLVLEGSGKCSLVTHPSESTAFESSIIRARPNRNKANPRFYYYLFHSPLGRALIASIATRTAVSGIRGSDLVQLEVPRPPLPAQRKIAAVLSAYDDLIENNTRRIAILEEMARLVYREWFVRFRFPGHEQVALVNSPLGPVPGRWEVRGFSDLLESYLGGGWGPEDPTEKEVCPVVVIRGTDFTDVQLGNNLRTPIRYITESSLEKRRLEEGDVIVENSVNASSRCVGTSLLVTRGLLNRVGRDTIAASFCKVFRPKNPELGVLIHLHLKHLYGEGRMEFYQHVATNGIGNFQARRFVESEAMLVPSDENLLAGIITALKGLTTSNYAEQNANIRQTRDLLLPRLVAGEVDVANLDIDIGGLSHD